MAIVIDDVTLTTYKYNEMIPTKFYDDCLDDLKKLSKDKYIKEIPENKYIIEPIRLFLLEHQNEYNIYVGSESIIHNINIAETTTYRKIRINDKGKYNLLKQLYANDQKDIQKLCTYYNSIDITN